MMAYSATEHFGNEGGVTQGFPERQTTGDCLSRDIRFKEVVHVIVWLASLKSSG